MPFEIIESKAGGKKGYRVKKEGSNEYFSKKSLPLEVAKKQRTALIISEHKQPLKKQQAGIIKNPLKIKPLPKKQNGNIDYGDVVPVVLEPNERVLSVEQNMKLERFIRNRQIPNFIGLRH